MNSFSCGNSQPLCGQPVPAKLAELKSLPEVHRGVCAQERWAGSSTGSWGWDRDLTEAVVYLRGGIGTKGTLCRGRHSDETADDGKP